MRHATRALHWWESDVRQAAVCQGVFCLADFSITFPVADMSCPAPAVVWQALRSGMAATSESVARVTLSLLYMVESFMRILLIPGLCRALGDIGARLE